MITNMNAPSRSVAELSTLISTGLPPQLVAYASQHSTLTETLGRVHSGRMEFGTRLVYAAGLITAAIYAGRVSRDASVRDHRLDDHLCALLSRPYSLGLAVSLLSRAEALMATLGIRFSSSTDVLGTFVSLVNGSPRATYLARRAVSLTSTLYSLVETLSFLNDVHFGSDGRSVVYGDAAYQTWPFLWNDDPGRLWRLREARLEISNKAAKIPAALSFISHTGPDDEESEIEPRGLDALTLRALLSRHGGIDASGPQTDLMHVESFVPLFINSHRKIDQLVDLLIDKTEVKTQAHWLRWFLGSEDDATVEATCAAMTPARRKVLLENAILAYCVAHDPVSMLQEYFYREPGDIEDCIAAWVPVKKNGTNTLRELDKRAQAFRARASVFLAKDELFLDDQQRRERARLAAIEMALVLGFSVRESTVREDVEHVQARCAPFVRDIIEHPSPDALMRGLIECAKMLENVLRFTNEFYRCIPHFTEISATGLPNPHARERKRKPTLGPLLREFGSICSSLKDGRIVEGFGTRTLPGLEQQLETLDRFVNLRNDICHDPHELKRYLEQELTPLSTAERVALLRKVPEFFEWLQHPAGDASEVGRIAPAVLHLNLVTTNRCGITTVQYLLRHEEGERSPKEITLYTTQPVAAAPGVFYGLPRPDKCMVFGLSGSQYAVRRGALWVDPILFGAEAFDLWTGRMEPEASE
jgi:hypothetical protein